MAEKVYIFDTTLRDGEQSPGASMGINEKVKVALQLEKLGVDIIEAGFAVSSPVQFDAIQLIAQEVKTPIIASLARAVEKDIDAAARALQSAKRKRIHTFIATSPIHREFKLKKSKEEILKQAVYAIQYAKQYTDDVEFSAEDATRTELDYLVEVVTAAIEAGATTINIPDTVGYTVPSEFTRIVRTLKEKVPNINKAVLSVHCHNDLGLAVANSLAAIEAGARQVEVSVNGIGERAGNAALEEIVMALNLRKDIFGVEVNTNTQEIYKTSRLVVSVTGIQVQPNKAIVGKNAFSHEAGIHQDGVLKERRTYEIMQPEQIGRSRSEIILGRHSGKHGLEARLKELGYSIEGEDFEKIFAKFTEVADKKKAVYDDELIAIVSECLAIDMPEILFLESVQIMSGSNALPTATVELKKSNRIMREAAIGNGPVDAIYKAINRIAGISPELEDYGISSISVGQDAMGEAMVSLKYEGKVFSGHGSSTDVLVASAKAYLNALNKILYLEKKH
jgi:2-isopropylmalate synthase